ncbi:hypothetical protein LH464_03655 [Neorhizobium sp. T786]|uniref:hypothetical protein n=1 Tax=Pseudorhizobium xiangyangii TaxID=2883104 RepID=UPI001CFFFE4A|nr:hypothetical protein [Neorhizobium xiangyangii]MCB5201575.1 hypothetical protein [Neorhizobium xiangyangii]
MLTLIAEAILAAAGVVVAIFIHEGHAAFPVYQLLVLLSAMPIAAVVILYGSRVWHFLD